MITPDMFDGDTTPEALAAWAVYRDLPINPGMENQRAELSEQDAFTAGFDVARQVLTS